MTFIKKISFAHNLLTSSTLPSILELVKTNFILGKISLKDNDIYQSNINDEDYEILKEIYLRCEINKKFQNYFTHELDIDDENLQFSHEIYLNFYENNLDRFHQTIEISQEEIYNFFQIPLSNNENLLGNIIEELLE